MVNFASANSSTTNVSSLISRSSVKVPAVTNVTSRTLCIFCSGIQR